MLVLTRKRWESVIISCEGKEIEVVISQIKGKQVQIGFNADKSIQIHRKEIKERIDKEKAA